LAQLLLKLTAPGVADIYQGDELVTLSLVDPDNRRPIDWGLRRRALAAVRANPDEDSVATADSLGHGGSTGEGASAAGISKLRLITAALDLRKRKPEAFAGTYEPVDAGHGAIAYIRGGSVFVAAEIFPGGVLPVPEGSWRPVVSGFPGLMLLESD
jgi:(1->4)-alpha-D-glucan 1-alpha-D-glucosylmutase